MTDLPQYVLRLPDGRWAYHLRDAAGGRDTLRGFFADGEPLTRLQGDWWAADREARELTARSQPREKVTGYRLANPAAQSSLFRAEFTLDQWREQQATLSEDDCEAMQVLYTCVTEPQEPVEHPVAGPFLVLDADDVPGDDGPWVASLPSTLSNRPEYHRCFPGHIPGLRDHLKREISRMPHVEYCLTGQRSEPEGLYLTIKVPFQQPQSHWKPNLGKRGQELTTGREVPTLVTQRLYLPVPDRVHGENYALARTEWQQQTQFWLTLAHNANVKACNACEGRGHVLDAHAAALPR